MTTKTCQISCLLEGGGEIDQEGETEDHGTECR